jgi:hypothetical protein
MNLTRSNLAKMVRDALAQKNPTLTKPHLTELVMKELKSVSWDEDYGLVDEPHSDDLDSEEDEDEPVYEVELYEG